MCAGQRLCATVYADFTAQEVAVESVDGLAETAFGLADQPSWGAFSAFVERRCLPCAQPDLQGYLASIGMDDSKGPGAGEPGPAVDQVRGVEGACPAGAGSKRLSCPWGRSSKASK